MLCCICEHALYAPTIKKKKKKTTTIRIRTRRLSKQSLSLVYPSSPREKNYYASFKWKDKRTYMYLSNLVSCYYLKVSNSFFSIMIIGWRGRDIILLWRATRTISGECGSKLIEGNARVTRDRRQFVRRRWASLRMFDVIVNCGGGGGGD